MHIAALADLRKLSLKFRQVASRLMSSNFEEALPNLRRFLTYIDSEPIISTFIEARQSITYDMKSITTRRQWRQTYEIPEDPDEEIAFTYQLLRFGSERFRDYQSFCSGYSFSNRMDDWARAFNGRVVQPFIGHINMYLNNLMIDAGAVDGGAVSLMVSGTGHQVTVAQGASTVHASNRNNHTDPNVERIEKAIERLLQRRELTQLPEVQRTEIQETAAALKEEIVKDEPKHGLIRMMARGFKGLIGVVKTAARGTEEVKNVVDDINAICDSVDDWIPL